MRINMPRIRSIKPEFFTDEDLGRLSPSHRLTFEGLWCHADKAGRLKDRPGYLKTMILPYDNIDFESILNDLSQNSSGRGTPFITRYCVDDDNYIQISNFTEHQRPHHTEKDSILPVQTPIDNRVLPVTPRIKKVGKEAVLGKGMEGKGKEFILSRRKRKLIGPLLELFNEFWDTFGDKRGRAEAVDAWLDINWPTMEHHIQGLFHLEILPGAKAYATYRQTLLNAGQTPKMAQGWLSGRRWEDELPKEETTFEMAQRITREADAHGNT